MSRRKEFCEFCGELLVLEEEILSGVCTGCEILTKDGYEDEILDEEVLDEPE